MAMNPWVPEVLPNLLSGVARAPPKTSKYACPTESKQALPSFLTEDLTDNDSDSSDEAHCL